MLTQENLSIVGSSIREGVDWATGIFSTIQNTFNKPKAVAATAAPVPTAANESVTQYLPWLLIGGGVLLVILIARK